MRFFVCQPRCFVRQRPRSAALVLAFPRSALFFVCQPPFFCCAAALSVRHHPLSRLFFLIGRRERLCFAKYPCPPARAPRRYRARGATVFGFSLARFRLAAPFFVDKRCVFAVGCRVFVPVCGLFRSQGLRFSRFNACFRHLVRGFGVLRTALSRFSAPLLGCRSPLRLRSLRSGGKCAPIFHLSTICFPQSFPRCGENVHLPVCFSPPFRFSTVGRTDPLPPRGGKVPLHARV